MLNLPTWVVSAARVLVIVAVPILLVATPLYIFVNPGFVHHEYGRAGFPPSIRFGDAERRRISNVIVNYLRDRATVSDMAAARSASGEIALRDEEVQHLVDVRGVTDGFFIAHQVALVLGLAAALALWFSTGRARLPGALRRGVWLAGGLIVFVLLFSLVDFDLFFTRFHQVFFSAGSWLFYEDDTLIQLYPLPLWIDAVLKVGATVLALAAAVLGLATILARGAGGAQP
ncbi:MAG: DUF1461 domain-containing protein [Chloroflexota bacterium]